MSFEVALPGTFVGTERTLKLRLLPAFPLEVPVPVSLVFVIAAAPAKISALV